MRLLLLIFTSFISIATFSTTYGDSIGNRPGALTFSLVGGPYLFDPNRRLNNTSVPSVIVGYNLTSNWGIEGLLGWFNTDFSGSQNYNKEVNGTLFTVDGVYHFFPGYVVEPFVLAGVGILGISPNRSDPNNEGNINAGVGSQFFISKSIGFRVDVRDLYSIVSTKNDVYIDAGMSFLFDLC